MPATVQQMLPPQVQAFPAALRFMQAETPATAPALILQQAAPLAHVPRDVPPPPVSTPDMPAPVLHLPSPIHTFLPVLESPQPLQTDPTDATLDRLLEVIVSIKALEANRVIPFSEKSAKLQTQQSDAVQSQAPCCKFCGSPEHLVEVCEEVNQYILTGMCKRSVFGKVVLPSGAELPRRIKGKGLRERFEEYHRQYLGQKAAQAYLEDLVSPQRPVSPDMKEATSPVMGAMTTATKATIPMTCEALGQPHCPERTLHNPQAASDQTQATGQSGDPRKATVQFSEALAVPRITARPISGWSGPENHEAASGVPPRMRESNFLPRLKANAPEMCKRIACDLSDAPMKISQRELLSLAPSVRAQVASAAARFPALPEEQAMYLV